MDIQNQGATKNLKRTVDVDSPHVALKDAPEGEKQTKRSKTAGGIGSTETPQTGRSSSCKYGFKSKTVQLL